MCRGQRVGGFQGIIFLGFRGRVVGLGLSGGGPGGPFCGPPLQSTPLQTPWEDQYPTLL